MRFKTKQNKKKSFRFCCSENKRTCMKPKGVAKQRHLWWSLKQLGTLILVPITAATVPIFKVYFGLSLLGRGSSCWNLRRWWCLHTWGLSLIKTASDACEPGPFLWLKILLQGEFDLIWHWCGMWWDSWSDYICCCLTYLIVVWHPASTRAFLVAISQICTWN